MAAPWRNEHQVHPAQHRHVVQRGDAGIVAEVRHLAPQADELRVGCVGGGGTAGEDRRAGPADHLGHGHDRAVEVVDAVAGGPRGELAGLVRGRGGQVDQRATGQPGGQRVERLVHRRVVEEAGDDDGRSADGVADRTGDRRATRGERIAAAGGAVPNGDRMPGVECRGREHAAHGAEAEEGDGG
jgi:hypothetical protein